ncbi:protein of unknown function (DUF1816) [Xenococcus sp. PCC 7305]|uniref:DUF1816 domain-containing protein n=1 Tax=Xenococcus sp. PCC 7305 TaxID=102125 RepID=UPI0002AC4AE6|nr:DUF1816 domain-containing protein [Xenococcus sp. PCC 7305]ELS02435.1 protein of unknown function (DUF1816) [Xenococcus sp. PCC 7305]
MLLATKEHSGMSISEPWTKYSSLLWWLEITTTNPFCIYSFGPFVSPTIARLHESGYVEDLVEEGAKDITVLLTQCQPKILTICRDLF